MREGKSRGREGRDIICLDSVSASDQVDAGHLPERGAKYGEVVG